MSTYTDASLIVTPNAYKESKLYSLKPTDGSGDLGIVRATTATRVNSDGLIEQVPYNLLTYSEQFNNATWNKINSTVVSNTTTAPNGTLTADSLTDNSTNGIHVISNSGGGTGVFTFSFYAKANTLNRIGLLTAASVNTTLSSTAQVFDLLNGTVVNTISGVNASIETLANSWFRCSVTLNALASGLYFITCIKTGTNIGYIGSGESVFIWGAQLVTDTSAKEYFPTTDRLNIPRIDYTNGSCPSILVEPQRTNLLLRSEEFDNASWLKNGVSVTANNTVSPNNTLTADRINNATNSDFISQIVTGTAGITYTFTIYIKNDNSTQTRVFVRNTIDSLSGLINWSGSILTSISSVTGGTLNFMELSNGWYRLNGVFTSVESSIRPRILPDTTAGSRSVFLWGAQLEVGSNATSYIPTVASAVTRNADVISKTGLTGITTITETFEDDTTNVISGSPTSYTMSQGRIKHVIGI